MRTAIKWPGAKWSYAEWIAAYIPPHKAYLEPFFGSGAVFFQKPQSTYETINDLDGGVVNFFRVCRDCPEELARKLYYTPFSRQEYIEIQERSAGAELQLTGEVIEDARRFCVRCCQGFGSKMADRVGWKNTKHSAGPINPATWSGVPQTVIEIAKRLKNAQIEQTDAVQLIRDYNADDCLIYADPPYLGSTRRSRMYRVEMMGEPEHEKLLNALLEHKGPVILSGYDNEMYNGALCGWHKEQKQGRANSAKIRTETLWMNFNPQMTMFDGGQP